MIRRRIMRRVPDWEWLPPRTLRENYVDRAVSSIWEAERQLYLAVAMGRVRARSRGIILGPEWRKRLAKMIFDEINPFALPTDIELSVEDAIREWPSD